MLPGENALEQALAHFKAANYALAKQWGEMALRKAVAADDHAAQAEALILIGKTAINTEQFDVAVDHSQHLLQLGEEGHLALSQQAIAWILLSTARGGLNDTVGAVQAMMRCLALLEHDMPLRDKVTCYTGVSVFYQSLGFTSQSYAAGLKALSLCDTLDDPAFQMRNRMNVMESGLDLLDMYRALGAAEAPGLAADLRHHLALLTNEVAHLDGTRAQALWRMQSARLMAATDVSPQEQLMMLAPLVAQPPEPGDMLRIEADLLCAEALASMGKREQALEHAALVNQMLGAESANENVLQLWRRVRLARVLGDAEAMMKLCLKWQAHMSMSLQQVLAAQLADSAEAIGVLAVQAQNQVLRSQNTDLASAQEVLSAQVNSDALTGLFNRRYLVQAFDQWQLKPGSHVLVMLDIDHFKRINDEHGHLAGDQVLIRFADVLRASMREVDIAARYGGEEFALLLRHVTPQKTAQAMMRLQWRVAHRDWSDLVPGSHVTISGGAVPLRAGESFESAVERADAWLYRAKHDGRDRVYVVDAQDALVESQPWDSYDSRF